jgi:hypothetical protein
VAVLGRTPRFVVFPASEREGERMPEMSLPTYASTRVPPGRSRDVIEALLQRIGVDAVRWTTMAAEETVEFRWPRANGSPLAFRLMVPFDSPKKRAQMLRALYWYLKSKIEAIELGLVDLEQEFFPQMLTQGGQTIYESVQDHGFQRLIGPDSIALPSGEPDASE